MEQIQMVQVQDLHAHEKNPRLDAAQVDDLVASIREHGIEVPLVAAPTVTGGMVVLAGHRRLTAALALSLTEVPVQVREDLQDARGQLAFIATENLHRDQLTAVEESRLVQDMLDLGMTQAQVAQQTALGKKRVAERVKLGRLAEATGDKVHRGQITVDEAMIIAEYSDDPDAVAQLEESAGTYNFDFYASRAKAAREAREAAKAARKQAKKDGLRVTDDREAFAELDWLARTGRFVTPELEELAGAEISDGDWTAALVEAHKDCPGHCVDVIPSGFSAGRVDVGCDQPDVRHGADAAPDAEEAAAEPDPWDEITEDDFLAARHHRESHLAQALPEADLQEQALDVAIKKIAACAWREWGNDDSAIALLEALTGVKGKTRVMRKLRSWPLSVLVALHNDFYELQSHHRYMAEGRRGSSYWGEKGSLRRLLDATGYHWSEPEQRAILLSTGTAHDARVGDAAEAGDAS